MDKHVGDEAPCFLPVVRLVREGAPPDALVQGHPLLLRLPHGVVDKHGQLTESRDTVSQRCFLKESNFTVGGSGRDDDKSQTAEKIKRGKDDREIQMSACV